MSEINEKPVENVVDDVVDLGRTWLNTALRLAKSALDAAADGLHATADTLGRLVDEDEA